MFKGVGNACRIELLRRRHPERAFVYSAEDLSTIGPVSLLADLAVIGTLGIDEPERNGYHYLRDLTSLSPRVEQETMRAHRDLYSARSDGRPALDIADGRIQLGSVVAAPFGVGWPCDIEEELPSAESLLPSLDAAAGRAVTVTFGVSPECLCHDLRDNVKPPAGARGRRLRRHLGGRPHACRGTTRARTTPGSSRP